MNKKALILVCVLLVCLMAMTLVACGGQYEMNGFIVDFGKLQSSYQEGDRVDLSVLKITASFTDDTIEEIPLDRVTIVLDGAEITAEEALTKITEKTGEHTLEIKYSDQVKSVKITVTEKHVPVLTKVKLQVADTFKSTYNYDDAVDLAGLKVIAVYDETDEVELALSDVDLIIDQEVIAANLNVITNTVGARSLKARYRTMNSENTVTITVNDVYTGVVISVPTDTKTTYKVNETIVLSGITAKVTYKSSLKVDVPAENIKIYLGEAEANLATLTATKGDKRLRIVATYDGKTGNLDLPIRVENYVSAIDVSDVPLTNFVVGDEISAATFAAAKLNVTYADPSDNTVLDLSSNGVTMTDVSKMTNTAGNKAVTVTYEGKTAGFNFTVVEGETAIDSLTVESTPYKSTTLTAGDTEISFSDLTIKAVYKEEYAKDDEVIAFADFATKGVTLYLNDEVLTDLDDVTKVTEEGENDVVVKVKYEGKFAQFTIKVNNGVTALRAVATKTEYKLDEVPTFDDVVVTATLNYGSKVVPISEVEFYNGEVKVEDLSVFTSELSESKAVRVKYKAFGSFNIQVVDYKVGIYTKQATFIGDVDVTENARYDFTGKVFWVYYSAGNSDEAVPADALNVANSSITVPTAGKTVTITVGDYDINVNLVVNNVLESIEVSNIPVLYLNTDVNFLKLSVLGSYRYGGNSQLTITNETKTDFRVGAVSFAYKATAEGDYTPIVMETLADLNVIASTSGTHYVKLTYTENDKAVSDEFAVTVDTLSANIGEYAAPSSVTKYKAAKETAESTTDVNSKAFEGSFFVSDEDYYLVGDDNRYKFLPIASTTSIESGTSATYSRFKADTKIYMDGVELTDVTDNKSEGTKTYKAGDVVYVTEYYNTNEYQFTADACGKIFKLSVLPDTDMIPNADMHSRVEHTFRVIDGFNVTDPRQLCLLEQTTTRHYWDGFKAELGLTGLKPAAIILHDNMQITKDSIPESFYYTLDDTFNIFYTYTDGEGVEHTVKPEEVPAEFGGPCDRTFLYEGEYGLFRYDMGLGDSFKIYGNYFDIDMTRMPRVAAFEANTSISVPAGFSGTYYGQYQSKISFLVVYGVQGSDKESFEFKDFAVKGNTHMDLVKVSGTSNIKQGADDLVYAGGLIFVKVWYSEANITNINSHDCFIPYFSYGGTNATYTNCKAYDSFQCALFVNKNSVNHLNNCHWKRANGPLMLLCQDWDSDGSVITQRYVPEIYADSDCVLESIVDADSVWFVQNGVQQNVKDLAAMDGILNYYFHKSLFKGGKFNVIAVSIAESGNQDPATQSFIQYGNCFVDRKPGKATIPFQHPEYGLVPADLFDIEVGFLSAGSATFTAGSQFCAVGKDNPDYALITGGYYLMDCNQNDAMDNADVKTAFSGNTYRFVAINAGPMGIMAEFYPLG